MRPFKGWIALSEKGHPAWFLGCHTTRKGLRDYYQRRFLSNLEEAGYKAVLVQIHALSK